MKALELKIIPPVIFAASALLMWWLAKFSPVFPPLILLRLFTPILGFIGLVVIISSALQFKGARTTIHPTTPHESSALITEGMFGLSRNPIYLGMLALLIAWACWLSNLYSFGGCIFFFAYMTRWQIIPEERALEKIFGEEFTLYKQRVRRWF